MKKQHTLITVITLSLLVIAAPLFAQGKGPGPNAAQGKGPQVNAGAGHVEAPQGKSSGEVKSQGQTGKTHDQPTIASKIEANDKLAARVKAMLPPNTSIADASAGFKNQGQFIAALHVSENLNIPFDQLKAKMTGSDNMSLGAAIHALKPDLPQEQTTREVKKAEAQAKTTTSTGVNAKAKTKD